jgi:hypothetical protein
MNRIAWGDRHGKMYAKRAMKRPRPSGQVREFSPPFLPVIAECSNAQKPNATAPDGYKALRFEVARCEIVISSVPGERLQGFELR